MRADHEINHQNPTWQEGATATLSIPWMEDGETFLERIWARALINGEYQVCSIPFFCYSLGIGDIVEANERGFVTAVLQRSGRGVLRVWSKREAWELRSNDLEALSNLGVLIEQNSPHLLALDVATQEIADRVIEFLEPLEAAGDLEYEVGWLPWLAND